MQTSAHQLHTGTHRERTMKAMVANQYGSPEVLQIQEVAKPSSKDHEILVRVRASTVNAGDSRMRSFTVPAMLWLPSRIFLGVRGPKQPIFGMELAGEVEEIGRSVTRFKIGDKVFASTLAENFGAHAEYKCLPEDAAVAAISGSATYEQAATLPICANTALHFLKQANIQPGQRVLINGASGSVGTFAVQLARYFGAEVTAVCSTRNVELVKSLGAGRVIDYTQADFTQDGVQYDVVFDAVGKTTLAQCARSLKKDGYYLHTALVLPDLKSWWHAKTTGKRIVRGTATPTPESLAFLIELVAAGRLRPVLDRCYPLAQLVDAHRYVDTGHKKGNVVVIMPQDR